MLATSLPAASRAARAILENGRHLVARERGLAARVVPQALDDMAGSVHAVETAVKGPDPEITALILHGCQHLRAAQRVHEPVALRLPAVEPGGRPHPYGSGAIQHQCEDPIVAQ